MRLTSVAFLFDFALLAIAGFIYFSPYFIMPTLIYPVRVDSLYVHNEQIKASLDEPGMAPQGPKTFLYNPSSVDLYYENFDVRTTDSLLLRGWYIPAKDSDATTILLLHDLNESKITCLDMIKPLHERGFHVCLVDMRGHGDSDGETFNIGYPAVEDAKAVLDSLYAKPVTNHVVVFGIGTGAAIGIQLLEKDKRPAVFIVQSGFNSFEKYVRIFADKQWGGFQKFLLPSLKVRLKKQMGYDVSDLNFAEIIKYDSLPTLFIAGTEDKIVDMKETTILSDSSGATIKNFMTVHGAGHQDIDEKGGGEYYNEIMSFINQALPKKIKTVRNKKLA